MALIHAHKCTTCGHLKRREEVDSKSVASGIIECLGCGRSGPLNVEIVEEQEKEQQGGRKAPQPA